MTFRSFFQSGRNVHFHAECQIQQIGKLVGKSFPIPIFTYLFGSNEIFRNLIGSFPNCAVSKKNQFSKMAPLACLILLDWKSVLIPNLLVFLRHSATFLKTFFQKSFSFFGFWCETEQSFFDVSGENTSKKPF